MDRRRPSYASVAGGNAASSSPGQAGPVRSGAFAHLMNPASTPSSYNYAADMDSPGLNFHQQHNSHLFENMAGHSVPSQQHSWGKSGAVPNYWSSSTMETYGWDYKNKEDLPGIVIPSYLRGTRYMEKLIAAHKARMAALREASAHMQHNSNAGSLSTSSSSISLHRMAPSHRGMTYDIVESSPVIEEDTVPPLPSQWKETEKSGGLEIAPNGLDLRCSSIMKNQEHEAAAARTDHPMPPQCGVFYYEVTIITNGQGGTVGIGFQSSSASLEKLPGWEPHSWAYHGDDGKSYCCQMTGRTYGATFTAGDVVGCGVNFRTGIAFFTKNGIAQGSAFRDLRDIKLYPSIGMKKSGTHVKVNFGQSSFMFDIDGYMAREKLKVKGEISEEDVSKLHPPLDESALCKELIAQFLRHDGYVETAAAFADEMRREASALRKDAENPITSYELQQDADAIHRQQIRSAILEGDIDKALLRTNKYYPTVLAKNPDIEFRLMCRKFVEMMRMCTDNSSSHQSRGKAAAVGTNGHHSLSYSGRPEEIFEQDMELDEPHATTAGSHNSQGTSDDWDTMDTEDTDHARSSGHGFQDRMNETLEFGKSLQKQYKDDRTKDQALKDIFSLFAYEDPGNSPTAQVMDPSGRVPVAEELNSAILVSLGKSSSAALERVCQQTDVLVAEISDQRGAGGAFVNIHRDLLS